LRVVAILAAWAVVAVLATLFFALGGSLGYRRGVQDTLTQARERRTGKKGCRPLPVNHLRRRTSGRARPGATARRARWYPGPVSAAHVASARPWRRDPRITLAVSTLAAVLLLGVPGTAIGATTAQPGESLWRLKLGLERVRVTLASGAQGAEVHADLASVRLAELHGLVADDPEADVVAAVSEDLHGHVTAATEALEEVADTGHRIALGRRLELVTDRQADVVGVLVAVSDCSGHDGGAATDQCADLNETLDATLALKDTTDAAVTFAEPVAAQPPVIAQDDADAMDQSADDRSGASAAGDGAANLTAEQSAAADGVGAPADEGGSQSGADAPASSSDGAAAGAGQSGADNPDDPQPSQPASQTPSPEDPEPTASTAPTPKGEAPPTTPAAADAADAGSESPAGDAEAPDSTADTTGDTAEVLDNVAP
jgi:hypothetical protein